jgi:3-(3-hydroxy-phenyl)propionate hydroxylase
VLLKAPSAWRILVPVPQSLDDDLIKSDDYVTEIFSRVLNSSDPIETIHRTIYRVHQRVVNKMRSRRIILAGDSAHLNNPLGGFGMNGGLHDAWNLAEKLDAIINHKKEMDLLDLYDRQRRTIMNDFIQKQTIRNKKMIEETGDEEYSSEWIRMRNLHENDNERRGYMLRQSMTQSLINEAAIK